MAASSPQLIPADYDIEQTRRMYVAGEVSPDELIASALNMARDHEDDNFFIHLNEEAVNQAPRFAANSNKTHPDLAGIPFVVKDNIHVAGMPNSAGTPGLAEFIPQTDNPVVAGLIQAGAIVLGKTNLHEMAFGITSINAWSGTVTNPVAPGYLAGGSSGGTAAAIAAGIVGWGLGSDTGGSVRIPAALCGICGFRPSKGRYSPREVTPISATRDTVGLMARHLHDIATLDALIAPPLATEKQAPAKPRLGVARDYYFSVDAQVQRSVDRALDKLSEHAELIEAPLENWAGDIQACSFPIALFEVVRDLSSYLSEYSTGVSLAQLVTTMKSPDVRGLFTSLLADGAIPEEVYDNALAIRDQMIQNYQSYFSKHRLDALVLPTTPLPARLIEGNMDTVEFRGEEVNTFGAYIHNTDPASVIGVPAISFPITPTDDGLPVGLELNGVAGLDRALLHLAIQCQTVTDS